MEATRQPEKWRKFKKEWKPLTPEMMEEFDRINSDSDDTLLKYLLQPFYFFQSEWSFFYWDDGKITWGYGETKEELQLFEGLRYWEMRGLLQLLYTENLISGCPCGCRGDFVITDEGLDLIEKERFSKFGGY